MGTIFTGIIIAVISSWITVQLSLKKFQKEKLWERKLEAYTKIIESLHNIKRQMGHEEDCIIGFENPEKIPERELSRLAERYKTSSDELLKYKEIGALIISDEAVQSLNKYFKETNIHTRDQMESINTTWEGAGSCIKNLIEIAKKDLKAKNNFLN